MDADYSGNALIKFLSYAGEKGLLKPETARSRKAAVTKILEVAEDSAKQDMRNFDLEQTFTRFQNINVQNYKPESLSVYRSRFESALRDFLNWRKDPSSFKPSTQTRNTKRRSTEKSKVNGNSTNKQQQFYQDIQSRQDSDRELTSPITMPVPLKDVSVVIQVANIPSDLKQLEADKIKRVISSIQTMLDALVVDDEST